MKEVDMGLITGTIHLTTQVVMVYCHVTLLLHILLEKVLMMTRGVI